MRPKLFGVYLPQISKSLLIQKISSLSTGSKQRLYFFYSEFLLRANRNPWYKAALNRAEITAIDGKGLHWAMWQIVKGSRLPHIYFQFFAKLPFLLRTLFFLCLFVLELIKNLLVAFFTIALRKTNFSKVTNNELILGRDFVYDLFKIAEEKSWKTLIIGGNPTNDNEIKQKLLKLYTKLKVDIWSRSNDSELMRDQLKTTTTQKHENIIEEVWFEESKTYKNPELILNSDNLYYAFPDLLDARDHVVKSNPDMIIVCLGGKSGKQEFLIDSISNDPKIKFTLAVGVGAALDHLGSGAKQTIAPKWMLGSGLEWLHRFFTQPYRRLRIFDSIFSLWWWTTVESFMNLGISRKTVVNIISRANTDEYLLAKRRNWVPGDVAWAFVQGGVEGSEDLSLASLREIEEETGLKKQDFKWLQQPIGVNDEPLTTSFYRFLGQGAKYNSNKNYLGSLEYSGADELRINWENDNLAWVDKSKVGGYLSPEKNKLWLNYNKKSLE